MSSPFRRILLSAALIAGMIASGCGGDAADAQAASAEGAGAAGGAVAGDGTGKADTQQDLVKLAESFGGGVRPEDVSGPHVPAIDLFHPDQREVKPALGGRVIAHFASQPANTNYMIDNSATTSSMLKEVHSALLLFDWETWKQELVLAERMDVEDTLVLEGGRSEDNGNIVYGKVTEDGDDYVVVSGSPAHPMEERRVPKAQVASLERGTVFTFKVREDVLWHDGHPFDAADVLFSWEAYLNPTVRCDHTRFRFQEIAKGELLDRHTVRFFFRQQYYSAVETFNDTLCILPRHLYDLLDPDNRDFNAQATAEERGTYINDNPHNIEWVGLGPYRVTKWERDQYVEAERFPGYFETDPAKVGYLDTLRWRFIKDDDAAFNALLNGDIDIFWRVKTEDYKGANTAQEAFTDRYYKAYTYTGQYSYTAWNMTRSKFSDLRVRTAFAHAYDIRGWIHSKYSGLAVPVTGPAFFLAPAYNRDVQPLPYDTDKAEELLTEAGWYDRNGDGTIDKDGEEMVIELLFPAGNKASEAYGTKLQESFAKVGAKVVLQPLEWASMQERLKDRKFDTASMAWTIPELESDPYQIWHSSQAGVGVRGSNYSAIADPLVDELVERVRRELDFEKRQEAWRALHERIYELQPYLFGQTPPLKIAFNKALRGVKLYNFAPGFRLRDMYYEEGTPGTRPLGK
jgi:peptide/nickel transport system substrate-binding protein